VVEKASKKEPGQKEPRQVKCPHCGEVVIPEHRFGSGAFLVLLFCGIVPAVFYWLLRHGKHKCPECGLNLD